ncbi:hypothetical protein [Methylobacterium sp. CM6247]
MADVLTILAGQRHSQYEVQTAEEFVDQHIAGHEQKSEIQLNAYTPQQVATAKRALRRKGIEVGSYVIAFPLQPAQSLLEEIREWLFDNGGRLHELEDVGKPDGMAVVDLLSRDEQFAFVVRFRLPQRSND